MITLHKQENDTSVDSPGITPEAVREELRQIITSRHFRSSKRSQQFLEYVVEQKLVGNESIIKERLIGIYVFGRDNNYATGDDPVVRVQAGEVRRRLERYLAESKDEQGVIVELPTGTYVPVFRTRQVVATTEVPTSDLTLVRQVGAEILPEPTDAGPDASTDIGIPLPSTFSRQMLHEAEASSRAVLSAKIIGFSLLLLLIGGVLGYLIHTPQHPTEAVTKFWGPILSSQKSIVINLGKPFVYTPSAHLFEEYGKSHPGVFEKGVDRHNQPLPLDNSTPIKWGEMIPVSNSGPAVGGVRAGLMLTAFLGRFDKTFALRFGDEGSFLELRDSPSIIVGAMNNRWTTEIDGEFHFSIHDNNSYQYIEEAGTKRTWRTEYSNRRTKDYGLITREPVGDTGQFLLKIAGLQDGGTEAACELVTNPEMLQNVVRTLPPNWQTKNLQILVATDIIGRKAGPPQVVAAYVW